MGNEIEEMKSEIREMVKNDQIISLVTYVLSDYGESLLNTTAQTVLDKYDRKDLMEIVYTSAKELVINATKANLKRLIFNQHNIDIENDEDYAKGVALLKGQLTEQNLAAQKEALKENNLKVTATMYYGEKYFNIKVKNNFPLLPAEEKRIREKFQKAQSFSSLLDYYMHYGDDTEGTGLGLTMVGILLDESNIDKHNFTLSTNVFNETAAKLEIPLRDDYISKRQVFENQWKESGLGLGEFREKFREKDKQKKLGKLYESKG